MSADKKTCGDFYLEGLQSFTAMESESVRLFAAGFVSGQAEKVHLGACKAAMFRPSEDRWRMIMAIVEEVCRRYELVVFEAGIGEIWICRDMDVWKELLDLHAHVGRNSATWHRRRAEMCGINPAMIDENFHERKNYGKRCD